MDHTPDIRFFRAAGVLDAEGVCAAPGALLIETVGGRTRILAAGDPDEVARHPAAKEAETVDRPADVLIPGLINALAHLDLTHIGPKPFDPVRDEFGDWLAMILRSRATADDAIQESVRLGIERSLAGGVVAVGDIAGAWSTVPTVTLRDSPLSGVSYVECFGIGARQEEAADQIERILRATAPEAQGVRAGVTPHAPYTVGLRLYGRALGLAREGGAPFATHLAESAPEHRFIADGEGLFRDLLQQLNLWDDSILDEAGEGRSPIRHFFDTLADDVTAAAERAPIVVVHCNDVSDDDLELLAAAPVSVVYCPRSSAYFGVEHRFGAHRYAQLHERGVNVALGTDSIVNLPPDADGSPPAISTLDEIRFLRRRDGDSGGSVPARTLLAMATTNGARALGLDPQGLTFSTGPIVGVLAIEIQGVTSAGTLAEAVAASVGPPTMLAGPTTTSPSPTAS